MADKIKLTPKKIVLKGGSSKDSIAGKISAQKVQQDQQREEEKKQQQQAKVQKPAAPPTTGPAKPVERVQPKARTVFIQDEKQPKTEAEEREVKKARTTNLSPIKRNQTCAKTFLRKKNIRNFSSAKSPKIRISPKPLRRHRLYLLKSRLPNSCRSVSWQKN